MSFVMGIVVLILVYRFWGTLRAAENSTKKAVHSGLNALVKGAAKLEATTPNLSKEELNSIREGRRQLLVLEDIESMSDEDLTKFFKAKEAEANTKTKK